METSAMLQTLRDPMGVPFYPAVFQGLMVLTFALHILFVNLSLGALGLAIVGGLKGGERWGRLGRGMAQAATAGVSTAIVLGVAPLLFVQVVYDPFWYASSNLSAAWVIGFVFIMMAAYGAAYLCLYKGKESGDAGAGWGAVALGLFLVAGFVMHSLGFQMLHPAQWLGWYTSHGAAATSGTVLHAFSFVRFLHFILPAAAAAGVFLLLYARYYRARPDVDAAYLDWTARLGAKLAFHATAAQTAGGVLWLMVLPRELRFHAHPLMGVGIVLGLGLLGYLFRVSRLPGGHDRHAVAAAAALTATTLEMSAAREALRMAYLAPFEYSVYGHRLSLDLPSTALFLATFVLGLSVLAYLLAVAFQAGRVSGRWEPGPRMRAWGKVSVGVLASWIVVVAGLGVFLTLR